MSKGGKSIIALPSTAANGTISKIVFNFEEGVPVTLVKSTPSTSAIFFAREETLIIPKFLKFKTSSFWIQIHFVAVLFILFLIITFVLLS